MKTAEGPLQQRLTRQAFCNEIEQEMRKSLWSWSSPSLESSFWPLATPVGGGLQPLTADKAAPGRAPPPPPHPDQGFSSPPTPSLSPPLVRCCVPEHCSVLRSRLSLPSAPCSLSSTAAEGATPMEDKCGHSIGMREVLVCGSRCCCCCCSCHGCCRSCCRCWRGRGSPPRRGRQTTFSSLFFFFFSFLLLFFPLALPPQNSSSRKLWPQSKRKRQQKLDKKM